MLFIYTHTTVRVLLLMFDVCCVMGIDLDHRRWAQDRLQDGSDGCPFELLETGVRRDLRETPKRPQDDPDES